MDAHEKLHYESFFKCQSLFIQFKNVSVFSERSYICQTCNKPFLRLETVFKKLFEVIQVAVSDKRGIPQTPTEYDQIAKRVKDIQYTEKVVEAKATLKKGQQVLERAVNMMKESPILTPKFDAKLMKELYRHELCVLQLPKLYESRNRFRKLMLHAVHEEFDIDGDPKTKGIAHAFDNPCIVRNGDPNEWFLAKKFDRRFDFEANEEKKDIKPMVYECEFLKDVEEEWKNVCIL